ncbi:hypothetical protein Celal_3713 [Cellulophaga algicola DSM 14237]|uniref:DUF4843 domain-containing protein n=1 Tax=Cellulophaga algicola (strain DSM 14237 / IC166 / ACAM 630) TaxID=688270 RepID=E6XA07_CELAD|nr:hypothetical protein [Cellulophaga algicola]ADV50968.1 hypothetical protein Celal_3713 [Cellulophaga algicola DSM 14237]
MKYKLFILLALLSLLSCSQEKNNKQNMIFSELINYQYLDDSRPGYYLQVNSQNCHYEIKVNDLDTGKYFDPYSSYSVRIPLNLRIFKSGEQPISVKILPFQGKTLSKQASLQLRLISYSDMTDLENDYGGSTDLWEWKMPNLEEDFPFYAMDTVFEAKVPFEIDILNKYASDLSKIDNNILLKEVINQFKIKHASIKNNSQDVNALKYSFAPHMVQIYGSKEKLDKTVESILIAKPNEVLQPLENFVLKLYGNGRIATLLNTIDHDSAIWWADKHTGEPIGWQPVYLFKNKDTGEWHVW